MPTLFFTGFPGFLASELLPALLLRRSGDQALCLVQPRFAELSRRRVAELSAAHPGLEGRIRLVEGDITQPGLGLADPAGTGREVAEIHHLAAVYDLSVAHEVGLRVNVDGTRRVLDFAEGCPGLDRFHYVSTCYVSGRHPGPFAEEDLEVGQVFNNFYEETKYLAEVEVRRRRERLPITIYRPSIVVGDSRTGATRKYDGPYFVIRWLLRQPRWLALLPVVGDPVATRLNVVPRDFVIAAMAHLAGLSGSRGKVYQLADPEPPTLAQMIELIGRATGRRVRRIPLGLKLAKAAIDRVPGVYRLMQIPSSLVDYMVLPTRYLTTNARADLAPAGIAVPPFASYVDRLVAFVRAHPEIGSAAMA